METIFEVVEEDNNDIKEEMVDDELQSTNEMIDDASGESGADNAETPPPNVQYCGVQYVGDNIDLLWQMSTLILSYHNQDCSHQTVPRY